MEYKYHPAFKHLTFFVITYLFLRHQCILSNEVLFINSIIITVFLIILDHLFIHNHLTPLQSLSDQYFDDVDIVQLEKELEEEDTEKSEKKKKKKNKKSKKEKNNIENNNEKMSNVSQNETPVNNQCRPPQRQETPQYNHNEYIPIGLNNYTTEQPSYPYERSYNENIDEYPEYLAYNE